MLLDTTAFFGSYPWRRLPGHSAEALRQSMDRVGISEAWVSHLSAVWWRDPSEGNRAIFELTAKDDRLKPVPAVHPGLPGWRMVLDEATHRGAPAVRCDPTSYGLAPAGSEMLALAAACGEVNLPLMMAARFEDGRQRHPNDTASELPAHAVRSLIRSDSNVRLVITHAGRDFIEEVHFGSTPDEARRIWWDICWVWGPPEDHLQTLLDTVGADRFVFGTGQPLRLPETSIAKLDLLDLPSADRAAIESGNAKALAHREP